MILPSVLNDERGEVLVGTECLVKKLFIFEKVRDAFGNPNTFGQCGESP